MTTTDHEFYCAIAISHGSAKLSRHTGRFFPFVARRTDLADWTLEPIIEEMGLSKLQGFYLRKLLESMELSIWFDEQTGNTGDKHQTVELRMYLDCGDEEAMIVSFVDLVPWLEYALEDRDIIGDEAEIAALEKLKRVIDQAISIRRKQPESEGST